MEDNQIKELFNAFEPELGATSPFMTRLQRNIKAVELVKQHQQVLKRRNRVAVAIAACSGFAMGMILTLLFPVIDTWVATLSGSLPRLQSLSLPVDHRLILWVMMAGVCVVITLNAYEIAMAKMAKTSAMMHFHSKGKNINPIFL
jgi:hydrogenase/urease accessory protein HupE